MQHSYRDGPYINFPLFPSLSHSLSVSLYLSLFIYLSTYHTLSLLTYISLYLPLSFSHSSHTSFEPILAKLRAGEWLMSKYDLNYIRISKLLLLIHLLRNCNKIGRSATNKYCTNWSCITCPIWLNQGQEKIEQDKAI